LGISRSTMLGDLNEPERGRLAYGRSDRVAMDAVLLEILVSDRKLAVVAASVVREFNFDPRKNPMGR
jgi:hypothetical protein